MDATTRIEELRRALAKADAGSFLVEPRVIRRVIRELHGYARLSTSIPHTESQLVAGSDVRSLIHCDELGLTSFDQLPDLCLLISQPEEEELQHWPMQELMQLIWRRLFHGAVDRELFRLTRTTLKGSGVQERIASLGQVEFDEAHFVLNSEQRLVDHASRTAAYSEFVAVYVELQYFAPDLLPVWFPSMSDESLVRRVIRRDIDSEALFQKTRLYGAPQPDVTPRVARDEANLSRTRRDWLSGSGVVASDRVYLRQLRRRDFANERGNTAAAVICAMRAGEYATSDDKRESSRQKALQDIARLVERLRQALDFPQRDVEHWQASLWELATNSIHGFWNADKRLLYDLQKVCIDNERVTYKVDLVKWVVSRGRRPLRRPLTKVREVRMARHLASSAARLVYVRLSGIERERLATLLHDAAHLAEHQMRERMRSDLSQTLVHVGLTPDSVPEQVAFDKLIEESLDCIASRGYLTMGYLRDAVSRNDLKLPDLKHTSELFRGDHLLRADDRLDIELDGVYRRGEFYLRWLQVTSSIFFGTPSGRFATQYLIIPFGGAKVIVVGATHLLHLVTGHKSDPIKPGSEPETTAGADNLMQSQPGLSETDISAAVPVSLQLNDAEGLSAGTDFKQPPQLTSAQLGSDDAANTDGGPEGDDRAISDSSNSDTSNSEFSTSTVQPIDTQIESWVDHEISSLSLVIAIGFLLMGLIHVDRFRHWAFRRLSSLWKLTRKVVLDLPLQIIRMPVIQIIWKSRPFVRLRRWLLTPLLIAFVACRVIPELLTGEPLGWWWVGAITSLLSFALNSRLGRDAEELTAEWVANAWYHLRARVIMALLEWIIDVFKLLLQTLERFLYAVDEWLRFHSGESWLTVVVKAVLGVVWSFISFVLRIYINLLIEPTLHPLKHFPVVTVAHKMFLPFLVILAEFMLKLFRPYLGMYLAGLFTGFNIFFLPGIFGFLVWELKENWRLYSANRHPSIGSAIVGSHGETIPRLLRPGFHSGTLPRLFRRMRRLEQMPVSFRRFSLRRATRGQLEHVEEDVRRFIDRELIHLLELCSVWRGFGLRCGHIHAASNSLQIDIECDRLSDQPVQMVFQEQSGWIVASIARPGWLPFASGQQLRSLENALEGFYRKAGIDLVREQIEQNFVHSHLYDINSYGLVIWPERNFQREITVDLTRLYHLRPQPASEALSMNLAPVERGKVVFADSYTSWVIWEELWQPSDTAAGNGTSPAAASRPPVRKLLQTPR